MPSVMYPLVAAVDLAWSLRATRCFFTSLRERNELGRRVAPSCAFDGRGPYGPPNQRELEAGGGAWWANDLTNFTARTTTRTLASGPVRSRSRRAQPLSGLRRSVAGSVALRIAAHRPPHPDRELAARRGPGARSDSGRGGAAQVYGGVTSGS